ncbi:uncharacterized protein LOC119098829 [Pollicipes pollicipes]|uniref:uncharacterized protein LOC119098829 n=1 Tax=Pollicipes pollicipes TaxID=41117 RepID=UPI001885815D|nr:uncharacterized protein LOC119098829 [Pollicipes pollicipes]
MESHLRRRRMNARRMSQMVMLPPTAQTMLAGLAEQGESSAQDSPLSRASTRRQSHRIRRSLKETPPARSRSNSLQPSHLQNGNQPPAFGTTAHKAWVAPSFGGGSSSAEPARDAERGGHTNPTFVITEESDFESETATPPVSEVSSGRRTGASSPRRSSAESRGSPAAHDRRRAPASTHMSPATSPGSGRSSPDSTVSAPLPLRPVPTISVTADEEEPASSAVTEESPPDDTPEVCVSKL